MNSEQYIYDQVKSVRRFFMAAALLVPATMLFGPFAAGAALACSIYGFVKLQKVSKVSIQARFAMQSLKSFGIVTMSVSAIVFILTTAMTILAIPVLMEIIKTGDLSILESSPFGSNGLNSGSPDRTDTWG